MSFIGEEEVQNMDPLLKHGAYIDPNPASNGTTIDVDPPPNSGCETQTPNAVRPDWLPPTWSFIERVRSSGATAGTRDKYYLDPVTNRRFRSKKEVLAYLETGTVASNKKKKNTGSDAESTPSSATPSKKKKSQPEPRDIAKYFNFDDVPTKIKWELTNVYEGTWRPLVNGVDRVPESSKQDWVAAFTYLALQNGGR